MSIDVASWFKDCEDIAQRSLNDQARGLEGSQILAIAAEVDALRRTGAALADFTVGDFAPSCFTIPEALSTGIAQELQRGNTNYPPAVGLAELRSAIRKSYARDLGLDYPDGCVQVGSGARPPIIATFYTIVAPGDTVVYPVPSWNNHYYTYLARGKGVPVATQAANGFMPTADELAPHLRSARLLCLCSPQNPTGTVMKERELRDICTLVLDENRRRRAVGDRPLIVMYDQVYWRLTFAGVTHHTPVGLEPEMARYTVFVDAISKCWAATGLRVGWAVVPPWLCDKMKPLIGHFGAWAGRAEQAATARLLDDPSLTAAYMSDFLGGIESRLKSLRGGLMHMKAQGLPVDALPAQGAIYLTAKFDLFGKRAPDGTRLDTDDAIRKYLLHEAGVAVVPFRAFGLPSDTGWMRMSVGAVQLAEVDQAVDRLAHAVRRVS